MFLNKSVLPFYGVRFWQQRCELQFALEEAAEHKIDTAKFTTPREINDGINRLHLEHLYTAKNVIISLYDLRSKILPEDALNIYPNDFHTWIDNTGAIELSIWINRSKPMIYESTKKAQSDDTQTFWSTHKRTNRVARKPRADTYKEFLSRKTIHIHADNTPLVDKLTRYSPAPPPRSFTLRNAVRRGKQKRRAMYVSFKKCYFCLTSDKILTPKPKIKQVDQEI